MQFPVSDNKCHGFLKALSYSGQPIGYMFLFCYLSFHHCYSFINPIMIQGFNCIFRICNFKSLQLINKLYVQDVRHPELLYQTHSMFMDFSGRGQIGQVERQEQKNSFTQQEEILYLRPTYSIL